MAIKEIIFPLSFFILLLPLVSSYYTPKYVTVSCSGANYTQNSTYQTNLDILFSDLISNNSTPPNNFFLNSTVGFVTNKVYGLYMCRRDLTSQNCHDCIQLAISDIKSRCQNRAEAVIWYSLCTVRYANRSIFSKCDTSLWFTQGPSTGYETGTSIASNFGDYLGKMMRSLMDVVAYDSSAERFALNQTIISQFAALYGLVQCTPDITDDNDCQRNLVNAYKHFDDCCNDSYWGNLYTPSCNFMFSVDPFFDQSALALMPTNNGSCPVASVTASHAGKRWSTKSVVTIVTCVAFGQLVLIGCIYFCQQIRKPKPLQPEQRGWEIGGDLVLKYDFATLQAATDNFSLTNKLGQGGFGVVYKGKFLDGQEVAIKKLLRHSSHRAKDQLKAEANVVGQLQHRNLVKLLGLCIDGDELLLVYEFLPNKSLDQFLSGTTKREMLNWGARQNIIVGIARGLLYLHEDSRQKIIHRDLKSSNILLDQEMNPKIADFGIAKPVETMQTHWDTSKVVGTWGYMAPEYSTTGQFSVKSDVFSFGVIILEIISGQKSFCPSEDAPYHLLHLHAWKLWNEGNALDLKDTILSGSHLDSEVLRCIHMALLCVQSDPASRPSMAIVFHMLIDSSKELPSPSQPAPILTSKGLANKPTTNGQFQMSNNPSGLLSEQTTDLFPR